MRPLTDPKVPQVLFNCGVSPLILVLEDPLGILNTQGLKTRFLLPLLHSETILSDQQEVRDVLDSGWLRGVRSPPLQVQLRRLCVVLQDFAIVFVHDHGRVFDRPALRVDHALHLPTCEARDDIVAV